MIKWILPLLFCCSVNAQIVINGATLSGAIVGTTNVTGGGGGGATKIFSTGIGGTSGGCTTAPATNTVGSTLFVSGTGGFRSPYPAQSSSPANTWTGLTGAGSGGGGAVRMWYVSSPSTSSSQTFSADGGDLTTAYSSDGAFGFSGVTTLDSEAAGDSMGGSFATIQPGSITPSQSGEVLVTCIGSFGGSANTWSIDSGFTIIYQGANEVGIVFAIAYKIKTDAVAENPTWTWITGTQPGAATSMAAFK